MRKRLFLIVLSAAGLFYLTPEAIADWSAVKRLTWTSGDSEKPAMAIDSNNHVHVVWCDDTPGAYEIYYKKSTDGGATWVGMKRLTWTSEDSEYPAVAIDSNNHIHVVWCDFTSIEICYRRSLDGGATWSAVKRLTWASGFSYLPAIAADSNDHVHVVWADNAPGNFEIYYKRSTDEGASWSGAKRLTWNSGLSRCPAMAIDSYNHIHVLWDDKTPGNSEIYHKRSTDGGATWGPVKRLTWNSGLSRCPAMAIDSYNHIHVVWEDSTPGKYEVYYKRTTDGGVTWSAAKRLTWTSGSSENPAIAVDSINHIHVIWEDSTPGNEECYYRGSTDGGATWSAAKRLTWTSGNNETPVVAIDSGNTIHVVWQAYIPDNYELYYKSGK